MLQNDDRVIKWSFEFFEEAAIHILLMLVETKKINTLIQL